MNEKGKSNKSTAVSTVLFSLILVLCCCVCAVFFVRAAALSAEATKLNDAVQICRNAAQVFEGNGSVEETVALLGGENQTGCLNRDFKVVEQSHAEYRLECEQYREKDLVYGIFLVSDSFGKEIYSLRVGLPAKEGA